MKNSRIAECFKDRYLLERVMDIMRNDPLLRTKDEEMTLINFIIVSEELTLEYTDLY